jgi:hypothetical protein
MKRGQIEVPVFPSNVYKTIKKSGSRTEYSLTLNQELRQIGSLLSDMPLRYASVVHAMPGSVDQDFHSDALTGERAIIYLTDVVSESNGPIEFNSGKVLGPAGTYAHYSANETHRGCKSDIDRYALALAFDSNDSIIDTIGALNLCEAYTCPAGYSKKDPLPVDPASGSTAICCNKDGSIVVPVVIIVAIVLVLFIFRSKIKKVLN